MGLYKSFGFRLPQSHITDLRSLRLSESVAVLAQKAHTSWQYNCNCRQALIPEGPDISPLWNHAPKDRSTEGTMVPNSSIVRYVKALRMLAVAPKIARLWAARHTPQPKLLNPKP